MVRTVIIPKQSDIRLAVPENYIGKRIEITCFALDELLEDKPPQKTLGNFFGVLGEDDFQQMKEYTTQARKEWNRVF